jgi:hypothetical protein
MFTVGVFQDLAWADRGLAALLDDGFAPDSISVMTKRTPEGDALIQTRFGHLHHLELKTLGLVSACGPLVGTLEGSDRGLQTNGLAGAAGRAGFQPHDGYIYETLVGRGGVLVAVESDARAADALAKLHAYGGGNAAIGAWAGRV